MNVIKKEVKIYFFQGPLLLLLVIGCFILCFTVNTKTLTEAPLNEEFIQQTQKQLKSKKLCKACAPSYNGESEQNELLGSDGIDINMPATGLLASPFDTSHMIGHGNDVISNGSESSNSTNFGLLQSSSGANNDGQGELPKKYDLREQNKLTEVKNQSQCGSCWCFATMAALEGSLFKENGQYNFSEQHMNAFNGFDLKQCVGGNQQIATAYLANWKGPILTRDVPYLPYSTTDSNNVQKHIQEVLWLPDRGNIKDEKGNVKIHYYEDNDCIKRSIMKYGPLFIALSADYLSDENDYHNTTKSAYFLKYKSRPNHAVAVVGWDDGFSKTNFNTPPPGDGAFIIKNSWGSGWDEKGYFYVSYYEESLKLAMAVAAVEGIDNYSTKYEHDTIGFVNASGYDQEDPVYFANVFNIKAPNRNICAVSFYTTATDCSYKVWVFDNLPEDSVVPSGVVLTTELPIKEGTIPYAGYHTIRFDNPLTIKGDKFSIVVLVKTPNYKNPIPLETKKSGYSSKVTPSNQSYTSADGKEWDKIDTGNVCLKAFANAKK